MKRSTIIALIALAVLGAALAAVPIVRTREHSELDATARSRAPGKFVALTQGQTHYQIAGPDSSPVVVLVHGFAIPSYVWDSTVTALAQAGMRVVRYDLLGRGYSDRPYAAYDSALFVQQLSELIDSLKLRTPLHLVGLSMGAAIVAAFTAHSPALVDRVVLIDPLSDQRDIKALQLPLVGEYLTSAVIVPSLPGQIDKYLYQEHTHPELRVKFLEQMKYKGFGRAILSTARHFNQQDHKPQYRALKGRKVLMISGAADAIRALRQGGELRQLIEPEFLLVEHAGHLPHYERPDVVNPALINFFLAR